MKKHIDNTVQAESMTEYLRLTKERETAARLIAIEQRIAAIEEVFNANKLKN